MSLSPTPPTTLSDDSYQRLKSEYDRLRLLYDISQQLSSTFNVPHVLQQVLATTSASTGAARGSIILFKESGEVQQHLLTQTFHQAPTSPFTNRVIREGLAMKHGKDLTWSQVIMAANTPMLLRAGLVEGRTDAGVLASGQVAGLLNDLPTCQELIENIVSDAEKIIDQLRDVR